MLYININFSFYVYCFQLKPLNTGRSRKLFCFSHEKFIEQYKSFLSGPSSSPLTLLLICNIVYVICECMNSRDYYLYNSINFHLMFSRILIYIYSTVISFITIKCNVCIIISKLTLYGCTFIHEIKRTRISTITIRIIMMAVPTMGKIYYGNISFSC
jgi:hypothetical protein